MPDLRLQIKRHTITPIWLLIILLIIPSTALAQQPTNPQHIQIRQPNGEIAQYQLADDESGIYIASQENQQTITAGTNDNESDSSNRWFIYLIIFGFIGQAMFMGRFALQWVVSEWKKQSIVPVGFWWLSLVGSSMLLTYFAFRHDPVGIAGQAFGWPIYARNLYLIARHKRKGVVEGEETVERASRP